MTGSLKSWAPSSKTPRQKHISRYTGRSATRKSKSTCSARWSKLLWKMTLLLFRLSSPSSQMKSSLNLTSQENRFCLHQSWILIFRKALTALGRSAQHSLGSTRTSGKAKCLLVASAGKPRIKCRWKPSGAPARRRTVTSSVILVSGGGEHPIKEITCKEVSKIVMPNFFHWNARCADIP